MLAQSTVSKKKSKKRKMPFRGTVCKSKTALFTIYSTVLVYQTNIMYMFAPLLKQICILIRVNVLLGPQLFSPWYCITQKRKVIH